MYAWDVQLLSPSDSETQIPWDANGYLTQMEADSLDTLRNSVQLCLKRYHFFLISIFCFKKNSALYRSLVRMTSANGTKNMVDQKKEKKTGLFYLFWICFSQVGSSPVLGKVKPPELWYGNLTRAAGQTPGHFERWHLMPAVSVLSKWFLNAFFANDKCFTSKVLRFFKSLFRRRAHSRQRETEFL